MTNLNSNIDLTKNEIDGVLMNLVMQAQMQELDVKQIRKSYRITVKRFQEPWKINLQILLKKEEAKLMKPSEKESKNIIEDSQEGFMQISSSIHKDLLIMFEQEHPSMLVNNITHKEGTSIFNMFEFTVNKDGREYLRQMFEQPISDLDKILDRQMCQDFIQILENYDQIDKKEGIGFSKKVQKRIKKYINFSNLMKKRDKERMFDNERWIQFINNIYLFIAISRHLKKSLESIPIDSDIQKQYQSCSLYQEYQDIKDNEIEDLFDKLNEYLDLTDSEKVKINSGINENLDEMKNFYNKLEEKMNKEVQNDITKYVEIMPNFMTKLKISMVPQMGFFICFNKKDPDYIQFQEEFLVQAIDIYKSQSEDQLLQNVLKNLLEKIDWKLRLLTETEVFFQNQITKNFSDQYGDLYQTIQESEYELVGALEKYSLSLMDEYYKINNFVYKIDAFISLHIANDQFNLVKPSFDSKSPFQIIQGKSVLSFADDYYQFVPIDFNISEPRATIIVGPNASGKSLFLKTLGQLIYLAQIGCFIPCKSANLQVFDQLLTKFSLQEDKDNKRSLFYTENNIIQEILKNCQGNSLILIDEYARSTAQVNGLACFKTLVEFLSDPMVMKTIEGKDEQKQCQIYGFISTNYKEIFERKILKESRSVQILTMKTIFQENQKPVFLYNQEQGFIKDSVKRMMCLNSFKINPLIVQRYNYLAKGLEMNMRISQQIQVKEDQEKIVRDMIQSYDFKK